MIGDPIVIETVVAYVEAIAASFRAQGLPCRGTSHKGGSFVVTFTTDDGEEMTMTTPTIAALAEFVETLKPRTIDVRVGTGEDRDSIAAMLGYGDNALH